MPFRSTPSDPLSLGRRLVYSAALTPRAIERMEVSVRETVERYFLDVSLSQAQELTVQLEVDAAFH